MRKSGMTAACAAGHFFIDFLCAWALFRFCRPTDAWAEVMLYYNFCAFALQMPLGLHKSSHDTKGTYRLSVFH